MKSKILLFMMLLTTTFCFAASSEKKALPPPQTEAYEFAHMTAKEYGELRGKKLNFFERVAFRSAQAKMQKKMHSGDNYHGFNGLGFVLGLFLSVIGIIGVSVLSTDRNLRKWTWIGAGVSILISLLFLL